MYFATLVLIGLLFSPEKQDGSDYATLVFFEGYLAL